MGERLVEEYVALGEGTALAVLSIVVGATVPGCVSAQTGMTKTAAITAKQTSVATIFLK
jgi:hypothetical protein